MIDDLSVIEKHTRLRRPDDERAVPSGLLGAGVRRGSVPVPAARLLRHAPFRRSLMNADGTLQGRANFLQEHSVEQTLAAARLLLAYELILERTYGIEHRRRRAP